MADRRADPFCSICRGSGTLIDNEKIIDGEYWCSFIDCDCTQRPLTEKQKDIIRRALHTQEAA
jgi:hypothetical protein